MSALTVQVGSTITNGSSAIRVTERVEKDPRWGTAGWRGLAISLEAFGGDTGTTKFVPDHLLTGWYHVPFEWRTLIGGGVQERYVWSKDFKRLQREVRQAVQPTVDGIRGHRVTTPQEDEVARRFALTAAMPLAPLTFPGKRCDQQGDHDPHLWQELHIPTGNPLVEHTQWWQCGDPNAPGQ
jgi:hypothetical protein